MIVRLQGGVGNQMFQYAFGRSVAQARNEELLFEKRSDMDAPGSRMAYSLGAFKTEVNLTTYRSITYEEPLFAYDKTVYTVPNGMHFIGYWQTEKYFDPELVRAELALRNPVSEQTQRVADEILAAPNSAFIHVRRTDYLVPMNAFMGSLTMDYYEQSMRHIRERTPDVTFFVFSDDPEWCRQNFQGCRIVDHNKAGTEGNGPGQEHEDIFLMSLCRHAIIANSSFGWWGAWLRDYPGKIVVAPNQWFSGDLGGRWSPETSDIVPERWVKLCTQKSCCSLKTKSLRCLTRRK
jgi:hypothetical protein